MAEDFARVATKAPRFVRATARASQARVAAAHKDIGRAEELYLEALRLTSQDGVATYHGRYLFAYGQMLRRTGRRRDAASRLVSARDFFESVDAPVMVQRCNQELRATGMVQHGPGADEPRNRQPLIYRRKNSAVSLDQDLC
jgi:hypothetical protein